MNVIIIPSAELSYDSGSVIYAKNLFKELTQMGHNVKIIGQCIPQDLMQYKHNIIVKQNLLFHPIIDDRKVEDEQYAKMLIDLLSAITDTIAEWGHVDLIHANYASINSFAAFVANIIYNVPYVISSFGRDINIGYNFDERTKKFIDFSFQNASYIITPEHSIKNRISELNNDLYKKTYIIPMPFDEQVLNYKAENIVLDESKLIISTINSCFTFEKGIDTIIRAMAKILNKYGDIFTLYIAGTDDDDNQVNYKRLIVLIDELYMKNNIKFMGYLSRNQVGYLLKKSDIFIDARTKGNFSSVLLEAQMIHTPTISSDNKAAQAMLNMGNGVLFQKQNDLQLAEQVSDLILNKEKRQKISENQIKWCNKYGKDFDLKVCTKKIIDIYARVINQRKLK